MRPSDGGIHAREWIAPAAVSWMLMELVENDAAHSDLTENLDWWVQIKTFHKYRTVQKLRSLLVSMCEFICGRM